MEEIDTQTEPSPEAAASSEKVPAPEAAEPEAGEQPAEFLSEETSAAEPEPVEPEADELEAAETAETGNAEAGQTPIELPLAEAPVLSDNELQAVIEAVVYIAEEPLTIAQMASALTQPADRVEAILRRLIEEFDRPGHGIGIREVAGGFKIATKPEHHDAVRNFVKSLKAPLKLSLPALETLAVIAYKQPVTGPEIMQIRGVQGLGVLKTLLDRKLIATAGRKNVLGKPMLYKTTKEFLIQFGLKDIGELPSLKEFEEIRRMAFGDETPATPAPEAVKEAAPEAEPAAAPEEAAPEATEATPEAAPEASTQSEPEPEPAPAEPEAPASETEG